MRGRTVQRKEDMSPRGFLELHEQPDGDIIVSVWAPDDLEPDRLKNAAVEFCSAGFGGGQSAKTLRALRALAQAMREDNDENPRARGPLHEREADSALRAPGGGES